MALSASSVSLRWLYGVQAARNLPAVCSLAAAAEAQVPYARTRIEMRERFTGLFMYGKRLNLSRIDIANLFGQFFLPVSICTHETVSLQAGEAYTISAYLEISIPIPAGCVAGRSLAAFLHSRLNAHLCVLREKAETVKTNTKRKRSHRCTETER